MKLLAYFDESAEYHAEKYDSITFSEAHASWMHRFDFNKLDILDVGCGSGRDSIYMSSLGGHVTAIDISNKFLEIAKQKKNAIDIFWLNDALPFLNATIKLGKKYDFILVSAVWMFLSHEEQNLSIKTLVSLLKNKGNIVITHKIEPGNDLIFSLSPDIESIVSSQKCSVSFLNGGEDVYSRVNVHWEVLHIKKS